jgi:serine/threonine-protein kinase
MIGKILVHYEITAEIGKGGMGEVYQAKDTKLGRDVAIKVLPEEFALDTDRVARFQREAKLLASLNHPNIAAIYGLEESDGIHFLVMELIEGDTLRDRIKSGPIPVEEALKLALQMAEALEAAHEKGVIHRDLKPANIKVTPDGKVKILDFGLAKAYVGDQENVSPMDSPTISAAATQQGVILGTAAYMSPEQARGKPVDKRADIWAFGVVLYEMLTGKTAFQGEDVSVTLASVITSDANLTLLPPNIHPRVREVVNRCLQKDMRKRYSGIGDARYEIEQALSDPSGVFAQPSEITKPRRNLRLGISWVTTAIALTAIVALVIGWNLKPAEPHRVIRFDYELPEDQQFDDLTERAFSISPDGRQFVYSANGNLYLRLLDELDAKLIPGTGENPRKPFFSPDGKWVGYISGNHIMKIAVSGGAPVPLTEASTTGYIDWRMDDTIVFGQVGTGILRVSANGGNPETIIKEEKESFIAPQVLPDGKSVVFTKTSSRPYRLMVQSLETGERKELLQGDTARYLPTGHLIYAVENNLFAIPFDLDKLEVKGGPISVVQGVLRASGAPQYAIGNSGTLLYIPGTMATTRARRTLVWVDRNGNEVPITDSPNAYAAPRISPDGTKVALIIGDNSNANLWIWDIVRKTATRLTFDESVDLVPLWTPDGKKIVYFSIRQEETGLYWKNADGTGEAELLVSSPDQWLMPWSWSVDGKTLVLTEFSSALSLRVVGLNVVWALSTAGMSLSRAPGAKSNIGLLSLQDNQKRIVLLQDEFLELDPKISPDGRWIAYTSNESDQKEVYVRPFPDVNSGKWQVSTSGGEGPVWAPNGKELLYMSGDTMLAADVETETTFKADVPRKLFQGNYYSYLDSSGMWDIHPDGNKFLMIKPTQTADSESTAKTPHKINIVLNWFEELKQRVPVD